MKRGGMNAAFRAATFGKARCPVCGRTVDIVKAQYVTPFLISHSRTSGKQVRADDRRRCDGSLKAIDGSEVDVTTVATGGEDELMSRAEICGEFRIAPRILNRWVDAKRLQCVHRDGMELFFRSEVEQLVRQSAGT